MPLKTIPSQALTNSYTYFRNCGMEDVYVYRTYWPVIVGITNLHPVSTFRGVLLYIVLKYSSLKTIRKFNFLERQIVLEGCIN